MVTKKRITIRANENRDFLRTFGNTLELSILRRRGQFGSPPQALRFRAISLTVDRCVEKRCISNIIRRFWSLVTTVLRGAFNALA